MRDRKNLIRLLAVAGTASSITSVTVAQTTAPAAPPATEVTIVDNATNAGDIYNGDSAADGDIDDNDNFVDDGAPAAGADIILGFGPLVGNMQNTVEINLNFSALNGLLFENVGADLTINDDTGTLVFDAALTEILYNTGSNNVTFDEQLDFDGALTVIEQRGTGIVDYNLIDFGAMAANAVFTNALGSTSTLDGAITAANADFVLYLLGEGTYNVTGNNAGQAYQTVVGNTGTTNFGANALANGGGLFIQAGRVELNGANTVQNILGFGSGNGSGSTLDVNGNVLTVTGDADAADTQDGGTFAGNIVGSTGGGIVFDNEFDNGSNYIFSGMLSGDLDLTVGDGADDGNTGTDFSVTLSGDNSGLLAGSAFVVNSDGQLVLANANALGAANLTINGGTVMGIASGTGDLAIGAGGFTVNQTNSNVSITGSTNFNANSNINFADGAIFEFNPGAGEEVDFNSNDIAFLGNGIVIFNNSADRTNIANLANASATFGNGIELRGTGHLPTILGSQAGGATISPGNSIGTMTVGTSGGAANATVVNLGTNATSTDLFVAEVRKLEQVANANAEVFQSDQINVIDPDSDGNFEGVVLGGNLTIRPTLEENYLNAFVLNGAAARDFDGDGTIENTIPTGFNALPILTGDRFTIVRIGDGPDNADGGANSVENGFITFQGGATFNEAPSVVMTNQGDQQVADAQLLAALQANQDNGTDNLPDIDTDPNTAGNQVFINIDDPSTTADEDFFIERVLQFGLGGNTDAAGNFTELQLVAFRQVGFFQGEGDLADLADSDQLGLANALFTLDAEARIFNGNNPTSQSVNPDAANFNEAGFILNQFELLTGNGTLTSDQVFSREIDNFYDGARALVQATGIVAHGNERINVQQREYLAARRSGNAVLASNLNGSTLSAVASNPELLDAAFDAQSGSGLSQDPWGIYVRGFGIFEEQDDEDNVTGYEADGGGVTAGVDYAFNDNVLAGLYFTYNATDVELDRGLGDIDIDTYRFGPYASFSFGDFFVNVQTTFGFHEHESNRNSLIGSTNADYDAFDFTLYASTGYDFRFDQFTITPEFQVQWTYYDQDDFSESGVGGLSLEEVEANFVNIRLGATFAYLFESSGVTWIPTVEAGWDYEAETDYDDVTARFNAGGAPFTIDAERDDESAVYVGAGFTAAFDNNVSVFVRYDGEFSDENDIHAVGGGVSFRF